MVEFSLRHRQRIAYHLLSFQNPRARRAIRKWQVDPDQLWLMKPADLLHAGFTQNEIQRVFPDPLALAENEILLLKKHGIDLLFQEDPLFPSLLREIDDPPDYIYIIGDCDLLSRLNLAVVGSRRAGTYGREAVDRLVPECCRSGLGIVSGMAYGIDSMAQQAAIREGTGTVGVNAGGLLHLYPRGNQHLISQIRQKGAIVSEFPMEVIPRPHLFPIRNRIISGLSRAVLVIEATLKSGSLITARLGIEQNRDVFAVPGPIDSPLSRGTHYLIQQGAKLVEKPADILDEFGLKTFSKPFQHISLSEMEKKTLDLLGDFEVKDMDYLVETLNLSTSEVISMMMGLILKNIVSETPDGYRRLDHG